MATFIILWLGQLVSLFGTAMSRFGLTIWAYQQTGQVTTLALMGFFNSLAYVLFSPLAGVVADRYSRKWVIILADLGAGLVTLGLLLLYRAGGLQIWHLYLGGVITNALGAFQEPAFGASVSMLVPRNQLTRANGMLSLANDGAHMFAPMLAGALLLPLGIGGIMTIDVVTCLAAVTTVLLVTIPQPVQSRATTPRGFANLSFGFRYISRHVGLLGILLIFTGINFFAAVTYFGVMPAMILSRSGGNAAVLGLVQSVLGIGGVAGGALLTLWGGPKNRVKGFLLSTAASFLLGDLLFAIGRSPAAWVGAAFASAVFLPFLLSCYEAIWQSTVPHDVQGRVFSAKNMLQIGSMPLGYLMAGFLADRIFEPAMQPGGLLADSLGWLVGTGPGAGMGLMFALTCVLGTGLCLLGLAFPAVRNVEAESIPVKAG
ncbi:MAG: MFS transporter [Anaerolineae bacterium]|nr:MFS transporter [Anaerolineae bacterium]